MLSEGASFNLCTDGSAYSQVSYEYAAWLATKMEFELEVLYISDRRGEQEIDSISSLVNPGFIG